MPEPSFIRPEEFWRHLRLRANQTVVHLGCGAGFYLIPAAQIVGKGGRVIGVDLLPHLLAECENRARRSGVAGIIKTIRANLELPSGSTLPAACADWVLVANILHQSDPHKILPEAARLVRTSGKVVVVDWDIAATPLGPPSETRISRADVVAYAQEHGLHEVEAFSPSPYHYGMVLQLHSV